MAFSESEPLSAYKYADGAFGDEEIFPHKIDGARAFFADKVYGIVPKEAPEIKLHLMEEGPVIDSTTGAEKGYRKQYQVILTRAGKQIVVNVLVTAPSKEGTYPALFSPNVWGNHSVTDDPNVFPSTVFTLRYPREEVSFKPESRGAKKDRFNVDEIVSRGFAAVTYSYNDIVPDAHANSDVGAYALYPELSEHGKKPGAIAMWAWSMSHIANAVSGDSLVDSERMAVMGFSRLGKAVHLALAHEHPFKAGIAVASGKAGAASLKSGEGEPSALMAVLFSHWYRPGFLNVVARIRKIPYGQKHLLALSEVPVLVSVDEKDWWSAPRLQRKTIVSANKIRERRGLRPTHEFITHRLGGHTVSPDWDSYIGFLKRNLQG